MINKKCEDCTVEDQNCNLWASSFLLLIICAFALVTMLIQKHNFDKKTLEFQKKIIEQQDIIDSRPELPDWYIQPYLRCSVKDVPESFRKDCIVFELKRSN